MEHFGIRLYQNSNSNLRCLDACDTEGYWPLTSRKLYLDPLRCQDYLCTKDLAEEGQRFKQV